MALRGLAAGLPAGPLSLSYNQDSSCCCLADFQGVRIWNLSTHTCVLDLPLGAISLARMLFCTSLIAFVGAGEQPHLSPRKLTLLNSHSNAVIQTLSFPDTVRGVHLNRRRLVAVLERRAFVYDLESLALKGSLDTPPNPRGLAALTAGPTPACLLALPADSGAVRVYDCGRDGAPDALCELQAHKSAVTAMAWDEEGCLLATASKKGTVVRVHAVRRSEDPALAFRRGSTPAAITCLAFSPPGVTPRLLCCASDHGTVHIFGLQPASGAKSLLSAVVPALEPQRPLATVRLPGKGAAAIICAVRQEEAADDGGGEAAVAAAGAPGTPPGERETRLAVATVDGQLFSFRLELPGGSSDGGGGGGAAASGVLRWSLEGEWAMARRG